MIKEKIKFLIKTKNPVLLIGEPGLGKTAICEQVAEELGAKYFEFRLSQINPEDFLGVPTIEEVFQESQLKDNTVENISSVKVVKTAFREEWIKMFNLLSEGKPVLINFDELNRAPREVSNTAFGLINERRLGPLNFRRFNNLYIVATANLGEEDGTFVEEWDAALLNRFIILKLDKKSYYKSFIEWGATNLPEVTKFLKENKKYYYFIDEKTNLLVTPRSWQKVEIIYNSWRNLSSVPDSLNFVELISPIVGEEASFVFNKFIQNKFVISPDKIFSASIDNQTEIKEIKKADLNSLFRKCCNMVFEEEKKEQELINFINFFFKEQENFDKLNQEDLFLFIRRLEGFTNENNENNNSNSKKALFIIKQCLNIKHFRETFKKLKA